MCRLSTFWRFYVGGKNSLLTFTNHVLYKYGLNDVIARAIMQNNHDTKHLKICLFRFTRDLWIHRGGASDLRDADGVLPRCTINPLQKNVLLI